ncbi:transposase [Leptothermofonsia sichuanensis E412]|nr:transposase [Leptothermofonsia sichuanensis E412]
MKPLLPPQKPLVGRPEQDHRTTTNGILWIDHTGAPRRELPERYGPWPTAGRFYRWRQTGVGSRIATTSGSRRQAQLGHPFCRWWCHPCASPAAGGYSPTQSR